MTLSQDQEALVRTWAEEGASISDIQTRLASECGVHLSYMDTRFLLLDLSVGVKDKDQKKEPSAPIAPVAATAQSADTAHKEFAESDSAAYDEPPPLPPADENEAEPPLTEEEPHQAGSVKVELSRIQRPGLAVSGTITFSDGQTGEWGVTNDGRLALSPSDKTYRPSQEDIREFQIQLRSLLSAAY